MRNLINLLRRKTVFIENINRSLLLKGLGRVCSLMGFIAGFNQIFHEETISLFVSLYNFHPSLLPYYRGPVPSYWCIKYGELFSGVTLHTVTPRVDQGHIVGQETIKISTDDPEELDDQISMVGSQMFVRLLSSIAAGTPPSLNKVQAESIYSNLIDYRSFPTVDDQKKGAGDISHDTLG
jgi:methionyl-tRNA formyltransferase